MLGAILRGVARAGSRPAASAAYVRAAFVRAPFGSATPVGSAWAAPAHSLLATEALKSGLFSAKPQSLEVDPFGYLPRDDVEHSALKKFLLWSSGYHGAEAQRGRASDNLFDTVIQQSENPELFEAVQLPKTFATTYGMMVLHMWLMLHRLRAEGAEGKKLSQMVYDKWQDDVELRVRREGVKVRVGKWLTELEKNFYGAAITYDNALAGGEGELEEALWRNVYAEAEGDPSPGAAALSRYVRRELASLAMTSSPAVLAGFVRFSGDTR